MSLREEDIEIDGMVICEKKYKDFCFDKRETIAIRIYRDYLNVFYTSGSNKMAWSPMSKWKQKIEEYCLEHPLYRPMDVNSRSIFDILYKDNKLFSRSDDKPYVYDIVNSAT